MGREPSLEQLSAEAVHASQRLALYRRKVLLGRGDQYVRFAPARFGRCDGSLATRPGASALV
jgi:hypothetical protein